MESASETASHRDPDHAAKRRVDLNEVFVVAYDNDNWLTGGTPKREVRIVEPAAHDPQERREQKDKLFFYCLQTPPLELLTYIATSCGHAADLARREFDKDISPVELFTVDSTDYGPYEGIPVRGEWQGSYDPYIVTQAGAEQIVTDLNTRDKGCGFTGAWQDKDLVFTWDHTYREAGQ